MTHQEGRQFSLTDFHLLTTLGTGTFGRVRLVHLKHNPSAAPMALKMLKKTVILKLKQVDHIKSEKSILQRVSHPFIIRLLATFQDQNCVYMLLEYVGGGELFSRLRKEGRFANDVALFYASEILLVFEYLHSLNVAYRDLKPENVLIDKYGHVKLTDFGFAKEVFDRTYTLCGTPEYLAPEIIQSKGHGKEVDWWALGILIYEMTAGFPPFYDENPYAIYEKILSGRIEFGKPFNPLIKDLIKKLLQADITKRYGCKRLGAEEVKSHRWFKGVSWEAVYGREIPPPWTPKLTNPSDTHFFDQYPESTEPTVPPPPDTAAVFLDF